MRIILLSDFSRLRTGAWRRFGVARGLFAAGVVLLAVPAAAAESTGQRSFAIIDQISDVARARVEQVGVANKVEVLQAGRNLEADIYILGQLNKASDSANRVVQTGEASRAEVEVSGDENQFLVVQKGGNGPSNNTATTRIEGDLNSASIYQGNEFGADYYNSAQLLQLGTANIAAIRQQVDPRTISSGGNAATISQDGTSNEAEIEQTGADNLATIEQTGSSNKGTIRQDGTGLSAFLAQTGSALEYTINQTGCVLAAGCGTVSVTQTSP